MRWRRRPKKYRRCPRLLRLELLRLLLRLLLLLLLGFPFFVWGCAAYAKNKGQSELLGFLGLFGIFGMIVLILLPDRS